MLINVHTKTISFKVVYYGAAMSGKTTNLSYIREYCGTHASATASNGASAGSVSGKPTASGGAQTHLVAGPLLKLATRGERTLYFDLLQLTFGEIGGYATQFKLYTVPGQTAYIMTRRLVLKGADAVVFVVDSQQSRLRDNMQSWYTLERQMLELGINKHHLPTLIQFNKRDMPYVLPVDQLMGNLHVAHLPYLEASASKGKGVFKTLEWTVNTLVERALAGFAGARAPEVDNVFG